MKKKNGFSLVELLVVMAIISVLAGVLISSAGNGTAKANKALVQDTVVQVAEALAALPQSNRRWPTDEEGAIKQYSGRDGRGMGTVEAVARVLAKRSSLGINTKTSGQATVLVGTSRCGLVDKLAEDVLKNKEGGQGSGKDLPVPSGGTVQDHVIYYAIDTDFDGFTEAQVCGEKIKVRATAIAWSAGPDGKLGTSYSKRQKDNDDNCYSWNRNRVEKK